MLKFSTGLKSQLMGAIKGTVTITASLAGGIGYLYSGTQPATADAAVTGTLLLKFTVASGAWVAGSVTNGIDFDVAAGVLSKSSSEIWSGLGLSDGTAGWLRFCGNVADAGEISTTLPRIDCRVSTSGAEATLSTLSIVTGATVTLDSFQCAFPSSL